MQTTVLKKSVAVVATVLLTASIAGCEPKRVDESPDAGSDETVEPSEVEEKGDGQGLHEEPIVLEDGRTITCVVYDGPNGAGGVSCDWIGPVDQ